MLSCPCCFTHVCYACERGRAFRPAGARGKGPPAERFVAREVVGCAVGPLSAAHNAVVPADLVAGGGGGAAARLQVVACGACGAQVGVTVTGTGVYHLFGVLPSHA